MFNCRQAYRGVWLQDVEIPPKHASSNTHGKISLRYQYEKVPSSEAIKRCLLPSKSFFGWLFRKAKVVKPAETSKTGFLKPANTTLRWNQLKPAETGLLGVGPLKTPGYGRAIRIGIRNRGHAPERPRRRWDQILVRSISVLALLPLFVFVGNNKTRCVFLLLKYVCIKPHAVWFLYM